MNALDERAVRALESIAESLAKMANPLMKFDAEKWDANNREAWRLLSETRLGETHMIDPMGQPSTFQGGFNAQVE